MSQIDKNRVFRYFLDTLFLFVLLCFFETFADSIEKYFFAFAKKYFSIESASYRIFCWRTTLLFGKSNPKLFARNFVSLLRETSSVACDVIIMDMCFILKLLYLLELHCQLGQKYMRMA